MMKNRLEIIDLGKKFGKKAVLNQINCELEDGIYGVLGPNGAGKTTLMRCITGLYSYKGDIKLNGRRMSKNSLKIGYLPQQFGLFQELTVYGMMQYFCNLKGIPKNERKQEIEECLKRVNLSDASNFSIKKLSGGMVRRVGIAQAILGHPHIILLDEPTAGLDPEERMRFKNIINSFAGKSIILISTHIVEDVEACCDHIVVMNNGRVIKSGSIGDIRNCADGRILEVGEESISEEGILFVEKSYLKNEDKVYRIIMKNKADDAVMPTVEDGYICLLKEN